MKAVLVDAYEVAPRGRELQARIFAENGFGFREENCRTGDEIAARCADGDVILDVYRTIGADVIARLPNCRGLVRYGIGYDVFDVDAATRRGIPVCNIPNYCIPEVASHTMALILGASRQLVHSTLGVRQGLWNRAPGRLTMHRFSSQTLGLIGFGHIAREVARYAKPFGFAVSAFDPYAPDEAFAECGVSRASLEEVISGSDVISCHTPLSSETRHLLNVYETL